MFFWIDKHTREFSSFSLSMLTSFTKGFSKLMSTLTIFNSIFLSMLELFQKVGKMLWAHSPIQFIFSKHAHEEQNFSFTERHFSKLFFTVVTHLFKAILLQNEHTTTRIYFSSFPYFSKSIFKSLNWLIFT